MSPSTVTRTWTDCSRQRGAWRKRRPSRRSAGGAGRDETDPLIEEHVMRSRWVVALLSLGFVALPACGRLAAQARGQDTRPGVAVMPFDNGGSHGQDPENLGPLQKVIAGKLLPDVAANPGAPVG